MATAEQSHGKPLALSCFVSAPRGVSVTAITEALQQRKITPVTMADFGPVGGSLLDLTNDAILRADLVIAVIGRQGSNGDIFVELGYASALHKPMLIVTPPDSETLPLSLAGLPQVAAVPQDTEAIGFILDQVLASLPHPRHTRNFPMPHSHPIDPPFARELLEKLDHLSSPREVEEVIASAIAASGIEIIVTREHTDPGVDLGVWSDDLDAVIGNPLPIEVVADLRDKRQATQLRSQMQAYLQATNARTALVLYLEGPKEFGNLLTLSVPNILFMSVRDFIEQLQSKGFGATISDLRNRVIQQVAA